MTQDRTVVETEAKNEFSMTSGEKSENSALHQSLSGYSVCVIEDDRATAKVYSRWLTQAGAKATVCASLSEFRAKLEGGEGSQGWSMNPDSAPAVVLADLVLPDGDGTQAISLWRKYFSQKPIIVITAFASVENAVDSMRKGAFDFLRKPITAEELLIVLSRAIEHSRILSENEALSSAVRILSIAQTLAEIPEKEQLLKTLGRLLHRELAGDECFVFHYSATRKHLECCLDFRNPGLPRRAPESIASQILDKIIAERPPPPDNFSELESRKVIPPQHLEFPELGCTVIELSSITGNCAFIVLMSRSSFLMRDRQQQFLPVVNQAQRTFQNLDVAAALSFIDELTGLYNQRFLDVALTNELSRAHRYNSPVTVVFIDIDKFKSVNDTYGHIVGSAILRAASKLLRSSMRDADQLLRYGGDEFVAILPSTHEKGALIVAERIRSSFENHTFDVAQETAVTEATQIHITTSIGLASFPEVSADARELVQLADNAMYESKRAGKNRITIAVPNKQNLNKSHRDGNFGKTGSDR
jgi:two-component system cell cycle response regulator